MVLDDDIIINGEALSSLFEIRDFYKLWALQPAFDPRGRVSHQITAQNLECLMRLTNFIEVTCPLFSKQALDQFMKVYDPILVGYGIDWWFLNCFGPDLKGKIAVIDAISCINPHTTIKGGIREIDTLQSKEMRIQHWLKIKEKLQITQDDLGYKTYGQIPRQDRTKWLQWIHQKIHQ